MIYKGYSLKPAKVSLTDIAVRVPWRHSFLTRHIEYAPTRRMAIRKAIAWVNREEQERRADDDN